jgi:hypothetical protein
MSYGHTPGEEQAGEEQEGPAGQRPEFGVPPAYPGQPGYASPGAPPPTYRAWGITATVCGVLFNLILGLPTALIARRYSKKVTELWARGDVQAAISASRKARAWLIASIVLDVIGLILSVVVIAQASNSRSDFNHPSAVAASIKTQLQQRERHELQHSLSTGDARGSGHRQRSRRTSISTESSWRPRPSSWPRWYSSRAAAASGTRAPASPAAPVTSPMSFTKMSSALRT